ADTPNYFLINLQNDQVAAVGERLRAAGATKLNTMPLAAGKLVAINGKPPRAGEDGDDRGAGETRVSWATELPDANKVTAGRWFPAGPAEPEISVEQVWVD